MDSDNDNLGLDQPLKLGRVSRIAKITDGLLFENNRGLPQIRNNYTKVSKALRKSDQTYASKVSKQRLSKSAAHQLKVSSEVENLQKVLSFYQLWCHGLFPKATFADCLKMLRGHKSIPMREYRRGLLDNEIRRLKVEKGIIVDEPETAANDDEITADLYDAPSNGQANSPDHAAASETESRINPENNNPDESDEDDWGILSTRRNRNNGLFIGDDDDDDDENNANNVNHDNEDNGQEKENGNNAENVSANLRMSVPESGQASQPQDEIFPDEEDFVILRT